MIKMGTVRAGKFIMCVVTWVIMSDGTEAPRKRIFKGITSVEGTKKEFKKINALLRKYPVFPPFDLSDMKEDD